MRSKHIETCSLASGSSGNAYFFRTATHSFLVDAGISCRALRQRLHEVGADLGELDGIFITHEHIDHIRGLEQIAKHYRIPLFVTEKTLANTTLAWDRELLRCITSRDTVQLGKTRIQALPKSHDAADPCFFTVTHAGITIPVLTDLGTVCPHAVTAVQNADVLYLECNYDPDMLRHGPYPAFLQQRISGDKGHLSNRQAAELVALHATDRLRHLLLSHLSVNNNTAALAGREMAAALAGRKDLARTTVLLCPRSTGSEMMVL